ncbi:MAG: HAMP domain-containing histidine kinase [Rhodospirillales bacterium]|nr:HAMP domain-containing histidine kinase [Rhodospirillales bacterium]
MGNSDTGSVLNEAGLDLVLLSNFVHQVVNPLNGVAGTLDNLAEGVVKEEFRREQRLRAARAQLEQCITLMRNLAFLAQGFRKLSDDERRKTVLPQVIIESAMFYQEDGKGKGIDIVLLNPEVQNRVTGHPELIRQVLMNIFDNSIKYSQKNSRVEIEQRIQRRTSMALITVRSTSQVPVSQNDINKLTELGFRGDNARKIVASGTGLGLYICRRILEDVHSGSLHIQLAPQNVIEITIKLPAGEAARRESRRG